MSSSVLPVVGPLLIWTTAYCCVPSQASVICNSMVDVVYVVVGNRVLRPLGLWSSIPKCSGLVLGKMRFRLVSKWMDTWTSATTYISHPQMCRSSWLYTVYRQCCLTSFDTPVNEVRAKLFPPWISPRDSLCTYISNLVWVSLSCSCLCVYYMACVSHSCTVCA